MICFVVLLLLLLLLLLFMIIISYYYFDWNEKDQREIAYVCACRSVLVGKNNNKLVNLTKS